MANNIHHIERVKKIVKQNWDEIGIATALGHFASSDGGIDPDYSYIMEAIRRSNNDLRNADTDTLREYVSSLGDDEIVGFVNNVKGIANEIYYVEAENSDGDSITAYLFNDTNHPDYDVVIIDKSTGQTIEMQLKATDDEEYVQEAIDEVGSDHVMVTSELAEKMGIKSTGISN